MNLVTLIGRLTADPEIRSTQSGKKVASYRLAVDRPVKSEGQPEADFINCVAWGKSADFCEKYLAKGMKIAVEGRIQTGSYTKDDGTKVYKTDVIVNHHEFCEKKGDGGPAAYAPPAPAYGGSPTADFTAMEDNDDQLPF